MLKQYGTGISLMLLDIVMPVMNGFEVLAAMAREHWMDDIPVIMISSEESEDYIRRAYEMGIAIISDVHLTRKSYIKSV